MRSICLALLCALPAPLLAGPAPAPLAVDDAVALAVKQNPRLSAAARDVAAARLGVRSAGALANPAISLTPAITGGGSDEELLIQQPLEINGARSARKGIASAQLRRAQAEESITLRSLIFEAKAAYYQLARARELHTIAVDLLKTTEELDRGTRRMVELGSRPGIEQTQTGIEVSRARQQVTLAASRAALALADLNTLLGRAPAEPVGILSPLALPASRVDAGAAVDQALSARTEVAAEDAVRDAFLQEARLARAEGRPDVAPQFRAESITRGFQSGIGVAVTLPLIDHGSRRNRIRQAEEAARAQADRVAETRSRVRREVESAVIRLRASESVVKEYQQGVLDQARQMVESTRVGFRVGATSILSVLESERTYRSVLTEYTDSLAEHALAGADLERATGMAPTIVTPTEGR